VGGWNTTAFCENMLSPWFSLPSPSCQHFWTQSKLSPLLNSLLSRVRNEDKERVQVIRKHRQAFFFDFSGANRSNQFSCSHSFPLFKNRRLIPRGGGNPLEHRSQRYSYLSTELLLGSWEWELGFELFQCVGFLQRLNGILTL
jgi:hypothetical protein